MVSITEIRASNARIAKTLPEGAVAVFVGATSGIGEYTLVQFAKHTVSPRVYFVGRSQEAADRIIKQCQTLNAAGQYTFVKADTSLIKNVDDVCRRITESTKTINLLFLTQGTFQPGIENEEGMHMMMSLAYHCRVRFIVNLLPLIRQAQSLRRVVTVLAGTKEGPIYVDDLQGRNVSLLKTRGHVTSMTTLSLEKIAESAPEVSFIHDFPGFVRGQVARDLRGIAGVIIRLSAAVLGPLAHIPDEQCGETQLFFATSAAYPARSQSGVEKADGVPVPEGVSVARGTDGVQGSGVYSIDEKGVSANESIEALFAGMRKDGTAQKVWEHTEGEFMRITGVASI